MNLVITRWTVPGNSNLHYYSGLPWTGFAMRDQSDNHDGRDRTDHGYETVTTAPHDAAQLACVKRLNGSRYAPPYQPVVTWPGCLEFYLDRRPGNSWDGLETQLASTLADQYANAGNDISFVDGDGPYRPEHPMVIIGRYSANPLYGHHRRLLTNWPLVATYGYRCDGRVGPDGSQPDRNFPALLESLGRVRGLMTDPCFIYPNQLSVVCDQGYTVKWARLTSGLWWQIGLILGFELDQFGFHELRLPSVEPGP